jgi:ABC-2 type transport system permease protein
MRKLLLVARRDFLATVVTKGFIIAVLMPPALYAVIFFVFPKMSDDELPATVGRIVVIDQTGAVTAGIREYLDPQAIAARRAAEMGRVMDSVPIPGGANASGAEQAIFGEVPRLEIVEGRASDLDREKRLLRQQDDGVQQLAVVVIDADAVSAATGTFGDYDLFVRSTLDDRIQDEIRDAAHESIVGGRIKAAGLDRQRIDALTTVDRGPTVTVTETGESDAFTGFSRMLPMAFAILLMVSVMSSGQYLLTTTVEEKSSRMIEVLLSAVSPFELLTGKILGQLGVGLTILVTYASMAILGLISSAMFGLLDTTLLVYLLIFFLITYVTMGSLMAAIGSAVNELREAQSLMTPVTLLMIVPWLFSYPISRDPNSLLAVVMSFLPPMNAVAMLLRMTSTSPPPVWEVWLSILVGVAGACAALWFASRVFKIGLLMHGRPPNLATLIKWARTG